MRRESFRVSLSPGELHCETRVAPDHGGRIVLDFDTDLELAIHVYRASEYDPSSGAKPNKALSVANADAARAPAPKKHGTRSSFAGSTFFYLEPGERFHVVVENTAGEEIAGQFHLRWV